MASFSYNPVDFEKVDSVEIVSERESSTDQEFEDSDDGLTEEQQRKQQLVELLEDDFDRFHTFLDDLLACYSELGVNRTRIADLIGVPDFAACENCFNCQETMDGTLVCKETPAERDGETYYNIIEDEETIPAFCTPDMPYLEFPADRIEEVNDQLVSYVREGYREYLIEKRERYEQRRQEELEAGNEDSAYVTEDIEEFLDTREEYVSRKLSKIVRDLYSPGEYNAFRNSAIQVAWILHLDDVLEDEYYLNRAEAFLRTLDSPHATEVNPGTGGMEFEADVRDFVREIGWPLGDRWFRIYGDTDADHKQMDINTSLEGTPTIIEVYTHGAHDDKSVQAGDYQRLYELAEGEKPAVLHLTDSAGEARISKELFELLLSHDPVSTSSIPGDYREYRTEQTDLLEDQLGDAEGFEYEFPEREVEIGVRTITWGGFEYTPSTDCVEIERWVEDRLQACSLDISKPYSEPSHWAYAIGPTVSLSSGGEDYLVTFHGGRDQEEMSLDEDRSTIVPAPGRWPYWLSKTMDCENVIVVEVVDDEATQNILTPRLLHTLLQFDSD